MTTPHKEDCKMAFGRKDKTCTRCQELLNGAKPIVWHSTWKQQQEAQQIKWAREHFKNCDCGPVCTYGEW